MIIIDDMISSGESMIEVATELKKRKAGTVSSSVLPLVFSPTAWTSSTRLMRSGLIDQVLTTNLDIPDTGASSRSRIISTVI